MYLTRGSDLNTGWRRRWAWLALVLAVAVLAAAGPVRAAAAADEPVVYVVQPGDRLVDIAARYGVSASAIVRANRLANSNVIYPGQRLTIPAADAAASAATPIAAPTAEPVAPTVTLPAPTVAPAAQAAGETPTAVSATATPGPRYHTVELGDTLAKIARAYDVTSAAIVEANNLASADLIYIGQKLLIPAGGEVSSKSGTPIPLPTPTIYTVQPGDTLSIIARRYDTTVDKLVEINGLGSPDKLRVGMRLLIPGPGGTTPSYPGRATSFVISISEQRCWLYRGETVIAKWVCSTGRSGSATRPGTYRIQSKLPKAYGSTWDIWMPYWLGIYWAGASENGIHGLPWDAQTGNQIWSGYLGTPITFGCIMLDNVNAKMLYDMAYIGMPVIVRP
ncbi:MAG: Muramidase-2 precursor [Chloroflexi bacterium ADurb.Bin325]|nr:MAG: Muramidase-2 precursor [Chloroflexi bacterium ADurb.Bin325]